jgi:indole-3-glycerol phosphate synthase
MNAKGQAELIDDWLAEHSVNCSTLKPHAERRLMNKLRNCVANIEKAHERAGVVIAEAKKQSPTPDTI